MQEINLEDDLVEKMAQANHQAFCERMRAEGYKWGPETDEDLKTHSSLVEWDDLPEEEREQNRGAARDIPNKLAQIGYVMIPAPADQTPGEFPEGNVDVERLAKMEHQRWMEAKLAGGWRYAPRTNKKLKLHEALLPWDELPEKERKKDRALVEAIPRILDAVGHRVAKHRPRAASDEPTVVIGVTGHRFLAEVDKVAAGIDAALDGIEAAFDPPLAVVSSLAEGADRLVVERARTRWGDVRLIVPLPMRREEYEKDFGSPESLEEFRRLLKRADEVLDLPSIKGRDEAYAAAGCTMLERSDVLLAVWDGQGAQGAAGTGKLVALARKQDMPVAWVHAGNRIPGTQEPTTLGEEQGTVTLERFPERVRE